MSKRAEELTEKLDELIERGIRDADNDYAGARSNALAEAAALIDAELRKERERCAERALTWTKLPYPKDLDIKDGVRVVQYLDQGLRAAILDDKEE